MNINAENSCGTIVEVKDLFYNNFELKIKGKLYGQDSAVDQVLERVYVAKAGLKTINKPSNAVTNSSTVSAYA